MKAKERKKLVELAIATHTKTGKNRQEIRKMNEFRNLSDGVFKSIMDQAKKKVYGGN